jgi:hypothetical protein
MRKLNLLLIIAFSLLVNSCKEVEDNLVDAGEGNQPAPIIETYGQSRVVGFVKDKSDMPL